MEDTGKKKISPTVKAFLSSLLILFILMLCAGMLTVFVPAGSYERTQTAAGMVIVPDTYIQAVNAEYPFWRWFTAPVEVLFSEDASLALVIILFISMISGAFATLKESGIMEAAVRSLVRRFSARRFLLLALISLVFMLSGSLMGIFEEVVPLIPLAVALALSMGWDVFTGLAISILATGFGFSSAIANPFSLGIAQKIAGLPVLSGAVFRIVFFVAMYALFLAFLLVHVRRLEAKKIKQGFAPTPGLPGLSEDADIVGNASLAEAISPSVRKGVRFFVAGILILGLLVSFISLTRMLSDVVLPLIALGIVVSGLGAALSSGMKTKKTLSSFLGGFVGMLPAGLLILMALSVKRIIVSGGILDTLLYGAAGLLEKTSGYGAALAMYFVVLGTEFFIGSASAKAFLLMPLMAPLADLSGISRQIAVQAFALGDGFSNMVFPTNAVLLISLGIAGMSYTEWIKKTWKLHLIVFAASILCIIVAVAVKYS